MRRGRGPTWHCHLVQYLTGYATHFTSYSGGDRIARYNCPHGSDTCSRRRHVEFAAI
jgi:hypothetical protein